MSQPWDVLPPNATRVVSRESSERQAWSESPSDRTQLLTEVGRSSSKDPVNEMVHDDRGDKKTRTDFQLNEGTNPEHILPNEATTGNEYKEAHLKPKIKVADHSNGSVQPITASSQNDGEDILSREEMSRRESTNYLDLIDDSNFVPCRASRGENLKRPFNLMNSLRHPICLLLRRQPEVSGLPSRP